MRTYLADDPLVAALHVSQRPVFVYDIQEDPNFGAWTDMQSVRVWLGAPLLVGQEMIGILSLGSLRPGAFGEAEADVVQSFTRQVAQVLENAWLQEQSSRRTEELEVLSTITIALGQADSRESALAAMALRARDTRRGAGLTPQCSLPVGSSALAAGRTCGAGVGRGARLGGRSGCGGTGRLATGLDRVAERPTAGAARDAPDEDVHTLVERLLYEEVGPVAGKLNTGRSRNDQVATDVRLWLREALATVDAEVAALGRALAGRAGEAMDLVLPGYTHGQRAQPVRWAYVLLAHAWPLVRDRTRLAAAAAGLVAGSAFS